MHLFYLIFYSVLILVWCALADIYGGKKRAVVIAIGGLGGRSFEGLKMEKIFKNGASAKFVTGFPTNNVATMHSIATGLYPKDHGVLMDPYLDFKTGKILTVNDEDLFSRKTVEPVWVTNQNKRGNTVCINWPGAHFVYNSQMCSLPENYTNLEWPDRLKKIGGLIIGSLFNERRNYNLALAYIGDLGTVVEPFGIQTFEYKRLMLQVDELFQYIYYQLDNTPFTNQTSLFVIGTHGNIHVPRRVNISNGSLADIEKSHRLFQVATPIARFKFDKNSSEPRQYLEKFLATIKGSYMEVTPNRIPPHWRTDKELIGDTLILARPGTFFYDFADKVKKWEKLLNFKLDPKQFFGLSGFDNSLEDMKGFFWWYKYGNRKQKTFDSQEIDVTDIKSFILEAIDNNKKSEDEDDTSSSGSTWLPIFSVYFLFLFCSLEQIILNVN